MLVKDLRKALAKMPGEMSVHLVDGKGVASAQHTFRMNLLPADDGESFDQFCELRTYFEEHTPQGQDTRIERETGFKTRDELIKAYRELKDRKSVV